MLFILINGYNVLAGIIGYVFMKNNWLIKLPLLVTGVLSFTWIFFPDRESLVADRWIILNGIFLSIFSAYGLIIVISKIKSPDTIKQLIKNHNSQVLLLIYAFFLVVPVTIGLTFEIIPYDKSLLLFDTTKNYIERFVPLTMQFNSLDIRDDADLLKAISWINNNTSKSAVIVGEKHWRGFMELNLKDNRSYAFSDMIFADPVSFLTNKDKSSSSNYLIDFVETKYNRSFL
jgi:hypothetical protein